MSSFPERATVAITSPVAGERFSNTDPPRASRSDPSMTLPTNRVAFAEPVTAPTFTCVDRIGTGASTKRSGRTPRGAAGSQLRPSLRAQLATITFDVSAMQESEPTCLALTLARYEAPD